MSAPAPIVADLAERLGSRAVVTDPDVVAAHARDEAVWLEAGTAAALVRASSADDVVAVLETAGRHGAPVVPRGAGSGLSGGANAIDGCVLLSLENMTDMLDIDTDQRLARTQPGILNSDLTAAVAEHGLWYPPDPSSHDISSIGGNVATNAGGLCCVKYGVTRDWVAGLQVVLADGRVVKTGSRTRKNVAGYDLTGLFVGSEGTLGVVTEVTVRLRALPPPASTGVAWFPDLPAVGAAVNDVLAAGQPSLLEIMDRPTIAAVDELGSMDLDREAAALLIVQADDAGEQRRTAMEVFESIAGRHDASWTAVTNDPDEGEQLLMARRMAGTALRNRGPFLREDVAVPVPALADYLEAVGRIAEQTAVTIATYGHAGDGNLHPGVAYEGERDRDRAEQAFDLLLRAALERDGVITGEHGVGILKRPWLADQLGEGAMAVNAAIKQALDPHGILNPGKAI